MTGQCRCEHCSHVSDAGEGTRPHGFSCPCAKCSAMFGALADAFEPSPEMQREWSRVVASVTDGNNESA